MRKIFVFLASFLLCFYPLLADAAAWSATDSFETYSVGSLSGDNGGTGWSGAWTQATAGWNVVSSPTCSGSRAIQYASAGADYNRSLTSGVTSGIMQICIMVDTSPTATHGIDVEFRDGTTVKFDIGLAFTTFTNCSSTDLCFANESSGVELVASPVSSTWYTVNVEFDQANNRARANVDGGAWSSYVTAAGGSFTSITNVRLNTNASGQQGHYFLDDIGVGSGPPAAYTPNTQICLGFFCFMI